MQQFIDFFRQHKAASIAVISAVVLLAVGVLGYVVFQGDEAGISQTVEKKTKAEKTVARRLDGVPVSPELANAQPIALMVENITSSRPQSGLERARVVYEALAEGGITRFVGIFDNTELLEQIGPIRSARPYFVDFAEEYGALYGHVGGSPQALTSIRSGTRNIVDLDQFFKSQYYWRSTDRPKPHNVYTSTDLLTFALRDLELSDATGDFAPWVFGKEEAIDDRGQDGQEISINYSSYSYKTRYVYDRASNTYRRFHSDEPHVMTNEQQIAPKNVIVQYVRTSVIGEGRLSMETDGSGNAVVFTNGHVVEGTWTKEEGRTRFFDANGVEIALTPGQIWVEVVPTDREVEYVGPAAASEESAPL